MVDPRLSPEESLAALQSDWQGLTAGEATRRAAEFGPNRVERLQRTPLLVRLVREFVHFFALILWVAASLCFFAEWRDPGSGMMTLGLAIVVVIVVNGLFAFWQEARAEQALQGMEALLPSTVAVRRDGELRRALADSLVPGDVIELEDGDRVPADVKVLEARSLALNLSVLTGESLAVRRDAGLSVEQDPLHATNVLPAGATVVSGRAVALVLATGMQTAFGRIAHLVQTSQGGESTLQKEIARVSRTIAFLAMAVGGCFFFLGHQLGLTFWQNVVFSVGMIVANVPEGLLPTVTLALAMAAQRMARRGALVRNLVTVETLGAATVICTDKTGTLTENRMVVVEVASGEHVFVPGTAYAGPSALLEGMVFAHGMRRFAGAWAGDPMEMALWETGQRWASSMEGEVKEDLPFDPQRKRLSVVLVKDAHRRLLCKGAPETLLERCSQEWSNSKPVPLTAEGRRKVEQQVEAWAEAGLRVLAFAYRDLDAHEPLTLEAEQDLVFCGLAALEDPPRAEVAEAIATCRKAGIRVYMVTGDHPITARAIGMRIGLVTSDQAAMVTGDALRRMSDAQLQLLFDSEEIIFARLDPDQKHRIVTVLKGKGEVVAVTGDGVNDAPALRAADIGVAMGKNGTDVARDAADVVLTDDHFATIVSAVEEGRAIFMNVRRFLTYHMTSNCGELLPFMAFALLGVPLPLPILHILAIDLGTDMVPALALGAELPDAGTMSRPPRSKTERLLNVEVLTRSYGVLGLVEGGAGLAAYWVTLNAGGWRWGEPLGFTNPLYWRATTACLCGIITLQMVAVFCCRHESRSLLGREGPSNRMIWVGVGLEAIMLVAINAFPPLQALLHTAPIPLQAWWVLVPFILLMLTLEEGRKALQRRRDAAVGL